MEEDSAISGCVRGGGAEFKTEENTCMKCRE